MNIYQRFKSDKFYRNAALFTFASLLTSGLNYLFYPAMARFMSVSEFGELQVIASFILQLSTVFTGLNLINITLLNSKAASSDRIVEVLQKTIFWVFIFISFVIAICSPLLQEYFHFNSAVPFLLVIPSLLISAISVFWTAHLQAKSDFKSLSVYSVTTGISKLLLALALVLLGLGVNGALVGIALSLAVSLLVLKIITPHHLPNLLKTLYFPRRSELKIVRPYLSYTVIVIVTLTITSVLLSIDTLIMKRLFSPEIAGYYAGVSTVARIIFFASAPLIAVMLPEIREGDTRRNLNALKRTLLLSSIVCVGGLLIFTLFSTQIITLMLGDSFANAAYLLPWVSILVSLAAITNVAMNYLLAVRSRLPLFMAILSIVLTLVATLLFHASIQEIVISISAALLIGQLPFYLHIYSASRKAKQ